MVDETKDSRQMESKSMKVTLQHIIESQEEYCAICKKRKDGRFTVFTSNMEAALAAIARRYLRKLEGEKRD